MRDSVAGSLAGSIEEGIMNGTGSIGDYIVIVLLAAGIVALGAEDLSRSFRGASLGGKNQPVLQGLREDLSTEMTEGVPVEKLAPQTEEDVRARYPFKIKRTTPKKEPEERKEPSTITNRVKRVFGME
jgi:hypothetical protein